MLDVHRFGCSRSSPGRVKPKTIKLEFVALHDQHAELDFNRSSSLKQQSVVRHVGRVGHITLIPNQPVFALSLLLSDACLAKKQQIPIL
jgi:hypothetical protein